MKFDPIVKRKIGPGEILLFVILFEIIRGNALAALIYIAIALAFFLGQSHFGGPFTLAQLYGLFVSETKKDQEKPTT
jgi:hypothetical protein